VVVATLVGTTVVPLVGGAAVDSEVVGAAVAAGVVAAEPVLPGVVPAVVVLTSTQAMIPTVT
jgi:hypothetical protein